MDVCGTSRKRDSCARSVAQDDVASGMPDQGRVHGRVCGPYVRFVKRMPLGYAMSRDGKIVTLRQFIRLETGQDPGREYPHPPMWFEGFHHADSNTSEGTWHFEHTYVATGTWWMRRADASRRDRWRARATHTTTPTRAC